LGYIGIVQHKEHSPEVFHIPPGTPCIYIYITTYQICSRCMSRGRVGSACYGEKGVVSNIRAQNPQTDILNQGRTKF